MLFPSQGSIPDRRIKLLLRMLKLQDLYTYQTIDSGPRVRTNVWVELSKLVGENLECFSVASSTRTCSVLGLMEADYGRLQNIHWDHLYM